MYILNGIMLHFRVNLEHMNLCINLQKMLHLLGTHSEHAIVPLRLSILQWTMFYLHHKIDLVLSCIECSMLVDWLFSFHLTTLW